MNNAARFAPRFRGDAATGRSQHGIGMFIVASLAVVGVLGVAESIPTIAILAVGAGAGYALSGSV